MRVLVACEFSGVVRDAFAARGHDAWSCDLLPTEKSGNHIQGDVLAVLDQGWDLMVAHPPCTYLCNSGVRWFAKDKNCRRWAALQNACALFSQLQTAPVKAIAIENPIPHKYARELIGDYAQIIQPWQFGHGETKATCLWLKNLPPLRPTNIVNGRHGRVWREPPSPNRWKNRSRTYQGIASAMADQWGNLEQTQNHEHTTPASGGFTPERSNQG